MKISIPAGSAVLHAASILEVTLIRREGALLAFRFTSDDLAGHLAEIAAEETRIADAILATDNEALVASLTDLKRTLPEIEREVRQHFQVQAATAEPTTDDTGSHPTATGDDAISNAPQQSSDAVANEEIENEPSQPQPEQPRRRRRAG